MRITLTILVLCLGAYVGAEVVSSFEAVVESRTSQLCKHEPDFC